MNDFACLRTDPDNPDPSVHIAGIFDWFVYCLIISIGICQVECFQIVIFGFCNASQTHNNIHLYIRSIFGKPLNICLVVNCHGIRCIFES